MRTISIAILSAAALCGLLYLAPVAALMLSTGQTAVLIPALQWSALSVVCGAVYGLYAGARITRENKQRAARLAAARAAVTAQIARAQQGSGTTQAAKRTSYAASENLR